MTDPIWARLQEENGKWIQHNFPDRKKHHPILGVFEEFGEFDEADDCAAAADALADVAIFSADVCNAYDYKLVEIVEEAEAAVIARASAPTKPLRILTTIGKIAHHLLKAEQGIRGKPEEHYAKIRLLLVDVFAILFAQAKHRGLVLPRLVATTWDGLVSKRDWKKDNVTAGGHA